MWHEIFEHNGVQIHVNHGSRENAMPQYRLTVGGKRRVFKGEAAKADMERAIRDASWEVWIEMRSFNVEL
jgi:hypothetical protein